MLYWTIQITIVSIILIFLVHHLINFFKSTLTVPKIKDLVNTPTQKYENMYNIILQNNNKNDKNNKNDSHVVDYTEIDLLPKPNVENMKNELKSFLKEQLKAENSNKDFTKFDELREYQTYSEY
jgi:hypothetical protein